MDGFGGAEPRIFPGIVHERTRRDSLRQTDGAGDGSGQQPLGLTRSTTKDRDGVDGVVEETEEEEESV